MYWVEVGGRTMPKLMGGHAALDLCNTYAGWGGPPQPRGEWLRDADALAVWCGHAGVVGQAVTDGLREEAQARPAKARRVLERVRALRSDLYATLMSEDAEAFGRVADLAQRSARAARLVDVTESTAGGSGHRTRAHWELPTDLGLDLPLLSLAGVAADLLVSPERAVVRACPGDACGWLFLDRRGTRRWCSMQTCGNRAKTRAFAARRDRGR